MNYGLLAPDEREQLSGTALTSGLLSALAGAAGSAGRPWGQVIANSLAGGLQGYQGTFDNALQSKLMQQRMLQQDQEFGLRNQELKMRMAEAQRQQDTQAQQQQFMEQYISKLPPEQQQAVRAFPQVGQELVKRMFPQAVDPIKLGKNERLIDPTTKQEIIGAAPEDDAPKMRTIRRGATDVYQEWNPVERKWTDISEGMAFNPRAAVEVNNFGPKEVFKNEKDLRNEFEGLDPVKTYRKAFPAYQAIVSAANRNTPQSDINLVYGIAKLYDPDSVVREGEYNTIAESQAIPERIKGFAQKLGGGGSLTAETKAQLVTEAESRIAALEGQYEGARQQYQGISERAQLSPDNVFLPVGRYDSKGKKKQDLKIDAKKQPIEMPKNPNSKNLVKGQAYQWGNKVVTWDGMRFVEEQ